MAGKQLKNGKGIMRRNYKKKNYKKSINPALTKEVSGSKLDNS